MSAPSESGGSCDELDPESEDFDCLQALYSKKAAPPCTNVRVYDNVQQYEGFIKAAQQGTLRQRLQNQQDVQARREQPESSAPVAGPSSEPGAAAGGAPGGPAEETTPQQEAGQRYILPGRRFTADQAPVTRQRKQRSSVLTRMEAAETAGPFARIKWCMDRHVKVKVYIRNFGRIRGVCTGYIVAFDKHWNLCLEDVDEIFQRKVRRKSCFLGDPENVPAAGDTEDPTAGKPLADVRTGQVSESAGAAARYRSSERPASSVWDRRRGSKSRPTSSDRRPGSDRRSARSPARQTSRSRPAPEEDPEVARLTARMALLEPPRSRRSLRRPVFETARRHVNQLFVRGDNVVLVAVEEDGAGAEDEDESSGDDVKEVPDDDVKEVSDDDIQVIEEDVKHVKGEGRSRDVKDVKGVKREGRGRRGVNM